MATGFEQVRSVVAAIAGDLAAADRVELELPETGVCSTNPSSDGGSACCGTSPSASTPEPVAAARPAAKCGTKPLAIPVVAANTGCCG
jgi:hypothetical protein